MAKPRKAGRFGGSPGHHNLMMANLATELFRHGRIRTTHAKAKTVQPIAERMITLAKRGDLHSRRQVLQVIRDSDVVHRLFADVGPAFSERHGGYTRVLRLGARKGDAAPMALIELVDEIGAGTDGESDGSSRRRWGLRRRGTDGESRPETTAATPSAAYGGTVADADESEADAGSDPTGHQDDEAREVEVDAVVDHAGAVSPDVEVVDDHDDDDGDDTAHDDVADEDGTTAT